MIWLLFSSSHFAFRNNTLPLQMALTVLFCASSGGVIADLLKKPWECGEDLIGSLLSLHSLYSFFQTAWTLMDTIPSFRGGSSWLWANWILAASWQGLQEGTRMHTALIATGSLLGNMWEQVLNWTGRARRGKETMASMTSRSQTWS